MHDLGIEVQLSTHIHAPFQTDVYLIFYSSILGFRKRSFKFSSYWSLPLTLPIFFFFFCIKIKLISLSLVCILTNIYQVQLKYQCDLYDHSIWTITLKLPQQNEDKRINFCRVTSCLISFIRMRINFPCKLFFCLKRKLPMIKKRVVHWIGTSVWFVLMHLLNLNCWIIFQDKIPRFSKFFKWILRQDFPKNLFNGTEDLSQFLKLFLR